LGLPAFRVESIVGERRVYRRRLRRSRVIVSAATGPYLELLDIPLAVLGTPKRLSHHS
jgi:hypothetical protein